MLDTFIRFTCGKAMSSKVYADTVNKLMKQYIKKLIKLQCYILKHCNQTCKESEIKSVIKFLKLKKITEISTKKDPR